MSKLGVNREHQKKTNRGLVLKLIATGQCASRVELARATGLTKMAITQIVNELIEKDYLIEKNDLDKNPASLGRNPISLGISPRAPRYAGILVQRGFCQAVLCDMELHVLKSERIDRDCQNEKELMEDVFSLLDRVLEGETNVAGIGAASIGAVDVKEGVIVRPLYFNDIRNVKLRAHLEERYGLPVSFDHDNQSAVLAEQLYGNGRGYQDILLVGVSRGVGCGILVEGRRMHSHNGYAPEIGHVSIDSHGKRCICGNLGCLEQYVNSMETRRRFCEATGLDLTYDEFCRMTEDPRVDAIMREVVADLCSGILSVLNILNSQIVLLCMDCCSWPDKYIQMIEQDINKKRFGNGNILVPVKKTYFLHQTQVLGAACNIINMVYHGELL
ncbi:MAG: ROK family transcriptional regulator [Eubacteriales bacterium]|nr:ROK family transcriptional regulator [Eubacteriales bacterium]